MTHNVSEQSGVTTYVNEEEFSTIMTTTHCYIIIGLTSILGHRGACLPEISNSASATQLATEGARRTSTSLRPIVHTSNVPRYIPKAGSNLQQTSLTRTNLSPEEFYQQKEVYGGAKLGRYSPVQSNKAVMRSQFDYLDENGNPVPNYNKNQIQYRMPTPMKRINPLYSQYYSRPYLSLQQQNLERYNEITQQILSQSNPWRNQYAGRYLNTAQNTYANQFPYYTVSDVNRIPNNNEYQPENQMFNPFANSNQNANIIPSPNVQTPSVQNSPNQYLPQNQNSNQISPQNQNVYSRPNQNTDQSSNLNQNPPQNQYYFGNGNSGYNPNLYGNQNGNINPNLHSNADTPPNYAGQYPYQPVNPSGGINQDPSAFVYPHDTQNSAPYGSQYSGQSPPVFSNSNGRRI